MQVVRINQVVQDDKPSARLPSGLRCQPRDEGACRFLGIIAVCPAQVPTGSSVARHHAQAGAGGDPYKDVQIAGVPGCTGIVSGQLSLAHTAHASEYLARNVSGLLALMKDSSSSALHCRAEEGCFRTLLEACARGGMTPTGEAMGRVPGEFSAE
ncbi:hypothetical protein JCM4814A_90250 [Streptomyces phaeofaciens JCM 4814]